MADEVIRLVLETKGAETIQNLEKSTANYKALLVQLIADYNRGEIDTEKFLQTQARFSTELNRETALLERLKAALQAQTSATVEAENATKQATVEAERAAIAAGKLAGAQDKVADSAVKAKGGVAGFGQSALQSGRVIQDFAQGGLGGILNNIEGLTVALGLGPGLAGALTILGVGFLVFKPQIEEFVKSFSAAVEPVKDFTGGIEALEAKIKEISEKPHKLSVDIQQLENAKEQIDAIKKGLAALEAAKSGRTEDEVAAGDKFSKEFAATGGEGKAAIEAVERQMGDAAVANDPAVRAQRKALADRERSEAATRKAQKEAEQKANTAMQLPGADPGYVAQLAAEADSLKKEADQFGDPAAMAKLRDNLKQASDKAREKAEAEVGNNIADVKKGNNPIARDVMAERFRAAGQDKFAGMVEGASPDAIKAKRDRQQQDEMNAQFGSPEEAAAAAKALEDRKKLVAKQQEAMAAQFGSIDEATAAEKAIAKPKEEAKKEQEKLLAQQVKDAKAATDAREKVLKEGTLDEEAAAEAARLRTTGMSPRQQQGMLRQQVGQRVGAAFPGIDRGEHAALTGRLVQGANQEANDQTSVLMSQGMSQQQATQEVAGRLQANVAALANQLRMVQAGNQRLMQRQGDIDRFMQQPGPANLPGGRQ